MNRPNFTRKDLVEVGLAVLPFVVLFVGGIILYEEMSYPRRCATTKHTFYDLATRINDLQTKIGRCPTNEDELVKLTGHALPADAWGNQINYRADSSNHFTLSSMSPYPQLDMFGYDSTNPHAGVTVVRF